MNKLILKDFNFIRTEMPELLDSFKITDNWIDKHGTYKQIIENLKKLK